MREKGVHLWPGVRILEGRWQDWLLDPEKLGEVLSGTPDGMGFDAVFVDTFAEGYEGKSGTSQSRAGTDFADLKAFFEVLPDILNGQDAVFSFWNGLGATSESRFVKLRIGPADHAQTRPSTRCLLTLPNCTWRTWDSKLNGTTWQSRRACGRKYGRA